MTEPILYDNMEKTPTESKFSITSNDINIELNKKFLVELRKNIYHGTYSEDVVDHIGKVLKMVDLIYVPGMDFHQLRMKVFPLSLADDAKESLDPLNGDYIKLNDLNEPFKLRRNQGDDLMPTIEEGKRQIKRKDNDKDDKQPHKKICTTEKFEAIKYSLGPNEEYLAIRRWPWKQKNIDEYWWRIYKYGDLEVLES
ncbi:hypothetical protein Tco_0734601 [Tanacetum coccineum]